MMFKTVGLISCQRNSHKKKNILGKTKEQVVSSGCKFTIIMVNYNLIESDQLVKLFSQFTSNTHLLNPKAKYVLPELCSFETCQCFLLWKDFAFPHHIIFFSYCLDLADCFHEYKPRLSSQPGTKHKKYEHRKNVGPRIFLLNTKWR